MLLWDPGSFKQPSYCIKNKSPAPHIRDRICLCSTVSGNVMRKIWAPGGEKACRHDTCLQFRYFETGGVAAIEDDLMSTPHALRKFNGTCHTILEFHLSACLASSNLTHLIPQKPTVSQMIGVSKMVRGNHQLHH